jgi:hypothetical protein
MSNTVKVIVQPDGALRVDASGFSGADCEKATEFLEKALGSVAHKRKKPEYYRANLSRRNQRIGS